MSDGTAPRRPTWAVFLIAPLAASPLLIFGLVGIVQARYHQKGADLVGWRAREIGIACLAAGILVGTWVTAVIARERSGRRWKWGKGWLSVSLALLLVAAAFAVPVWRPYPASHVCWGLLALSVVTLSLIRRVKPSTTLEGCLAFSGILTTVALSVAIKGLVVTLLGFFAFSIIGIGLGLHWQGLRKPGPSPNGRSKD